MKKQKYWFPANRFGCGWSFPTVWQGWLVLIIYGGGLVSTGVFYPPEKHVLLFFVLVAMLTTLLVFVCYKKGEKTSWRSGKK